MSCVSSTGLLPASTANKSTMVKGDDHKKKNCNTAGETFYKAQQMLRL